MAEQRETTIVEVQFDTGKSEEKLRSVVAEMAKLKQQQKDLKDQMEKGVEITDEQTRAYADNERTIKELTAQQKALSGQLRATSKTSSDLGTSFKELDAQCRELEFQYKSLTKAQRESAEGQAMKKQLIETKKTLEDFDAELGNHQRKVGNYPDLLGKIFPRLGAMAKAVASTGASAAGAAGGFRALSGAIKGATLAALKFLATPIGLILAAVAAAIGLLVKAFKTLSGAIAKNDDASTALARVYAVTLQPIVNGITAAFAKMAEWVGKAADAFANWLGGTNSASKRADDLVKSVDNLQEAERQYTVNSAKRNAEIARLRDEAQDKEKYTLEERRKMLEEARDLEAQNLEERKKNAAENLRILEETAKRERDTSDATKDKIAQARAAMYQAEEEYHNGVRRMNKQIQSLIDEDRRATEEAEKAKTDALKQQAEEREKIRLKEAEKLADLREKIRLRDMSDYEREKDALKKAQEEELATEGLTIEERIKIRQYYIEQMAKLDNEYVEQLKARSSALTEGLLEGEDAEEDTSESYADTVRRIYGLDDEALEYYFELLDQGVDRTKAAQMAVADQTSRMQKTWVDSFAAMGDSMTQMGSAMMDLAGKDKKAAAAAKAFSFIGILTSQATAIAKGAEAVAKGIASAAALPFPANIPAIVSITAQITGMMAGVMASIVQAKQIFSKANDAGKFEHGGTIGGNSYTGDKLIAHVNSGEGIYTGTQANNLLQEIANNPARGGLDYAAMAETFAAAVSTLPAPVMVLQEFKEFDQKVATYNEIASV